MLLFARHGLLMIVHRARLVFLWHRFLSSLRLSRLHRVTTFLMSSGSFFAFGPPLKMCVVVIGTHCVLPSWYQTRPRFPPTCFGSVSTLSGAADSVSDTSDSGNACSSLAGRLLMPWSALSPSAGPGSCLLEPTTSFPSSSCLGALLGWPMSTNDELPPYFLPRS
jgi:hypothetical protein